MTYGSDWDNIPEPNPWFAMEGMVTRQYPGKPQYGQLNPDERIDVETAIEIFTRNGAVAMEKEDETGADRKGEERSGEGKESWDSWGGGGTDVGGH